MKIEASYHRPKVLSAWLGPCPGQEQRSGVDVRGTGVTDLESTRCEHWRRGAAWGRGLGAVRCGGEYR